MSKVQAILEQVGDLNSEETKALAVNVMGQLNDDAQRAVIIEICEDDDTDAFGDELAAQLEDRGYGLSN